MISVARYVLVFCPSFPLPAGHTTIIGHAHFVDNEIAPGTGTLVVEVNRWTVEGIRLVFPTDEDKTDTLKIYMAQEQSARGALLHPGSSTEQPISDQSSSPSCRPWHRTRNYYLSSQHRPLVSRNNKSGIHNR